MRKEKVLKKRRTWKAFRLFVAYQVMFTVLLLSLTSSSYGLSTDREQIATGTFATAFVFTKTVDGLLDNTTQARDEAAAQEASAKELATVCKQVDLEEARKQAKASKQAIVLAEQTVDKARLAVDELARYLTRAEQEVRKTDEAVEKRLIEEAAQNGKRMDETQLRQARQQDADVQSIEDLYQYIKKTLDEAEKALKKAEKHAAMVMKSAEKCDEAVKKKEDEDKKKGEGHPVKHNDQEQPAKQPDSEKKSGNENDEEISPETPSTESPQADNMTAEGEQ